MRAEHPNQPETYDPGPHFTNACQSQSQRADHSPLEIIKTYSHPAGQSLLRQQDGNYLQGVQQKNVVKHSKESLNFAQKVMIAL